MQGGEIENLPKNLPIKAEIWNVAEDQNSGLFIREEVLDAVYQSNYTKDINEGVELIGFPNGKESQEEKEEEKSYSQAYVPGESYWIEGVNTTGCIDGFKEKEIAWSEGWNWEKFQKEQDVCIVNQEIAKQEDMKLGDILSLSLQRYYQDISGVSLYSEKLEPIQSEIVGTADFTSLDAEIAKPDILIPLENAKLIFEKNQKPYFASSLSFQVKNPMKLNVLKKEMKEAGLQSVVQGAAHSYAGAGLKMDDAVFIESVTSLQKSLSLLEGFLPFVFLVVMMLGYIVPNLLLSGRREEYAIMRALGTSRRKEHSVFYGAYPVGCSGVCSGNDDRTIIPYSRCRQCLFHMGIIPYLLCTGSGGIHGNVRKIQRSSCVVTQRLRGRYGENYRRKCKLFLSEQVSDDRGSKAGVLYLSVGEIICGHRGIRQWEKYLFISSGRA